MLPEHFVDTGLFRLVRYPNYLGEMIFWTGVFVSGIGVFTGALQWIVEILRYTRIVYEMFGGARCLEIRQNRRYGQGSEYQAHVKSHPICRL